jgi:hypothetical protein
VEIATALANADYPGLMAALGATPPAFKRNCRMAETPARRALCDRS